MIPMIESVDKNIETIIILFHVFKNLEEKWNIWNWDRKDIFIRLKLNF